jgi:hypothetical protein
MGFGFALAVLLLIAIAMLRLRGRFGTRLPDALRDDDIRQIEERGRVEVDEPLDLRHIQEEERRFREETWDEPEEF